MRITVTVKTIGKLRDRREFTIVGEQDLTYVPEPAAFNAIALSTLEAISKLFDDTRAMGYSVKHIDVTIED